MPLTMVASLVLLLGSLSAQTAALQGRLAAAGERLLRQEEDTLASAAHQLVARLNGSHRCLLPLPMASWESHGAGCADGPAREALAKGDVLGVGYRLVGWTPASGGAGGAQAAELQLELAAREDRPARRGAFLVALAAGEGGGSPLAVDVRELGLRGVTP